MIQTIEHCLHSARRQLQSSVDDPYTDAHVLMGYCLQKNRAWLVAHGDDELRADQYDAFMQLVDQRRRGVPVAYLTGVREFWSMDFQVTPDTLIPRPETEHLIEQALLLDLPDKGINALDFGTGTGVIAIALKKERPSWQIHAIDQSPEALAVARRNASRHAAAINFLQGNDLRAYTNKQFDLIVSNPPYIEADDPHLEQGDVRFEPHPALVSGQDGLDCIRLLVEQAPSCLRSPGFLMMEHGYNQADAVHELFLDRGFRNIQTIRDLSGHERITSAQWAAEGSG